MGTDPVVLIHGAWAGAWVWERLTPHLESAGLITQALDLPGNGADDTPPAAVSLDRYVAHVGAVLDRLGGRASLVAHSGGGVVASAVAEAFPDRVARIAYVAGMMLPDGMGFADLVAEARARHPEAAGIGPHLIWSPDRLTSRVPEAAARAIFFQDGPESDAQAAARRLTPQPERGRAVRARLTAEGFGRVPRLYVEALHDRAVIPALQRQMCALVPGAARVALPTGHAPQLSAPDRLAAALLPFLLSDAPGTSFAAQPADARHRPRSAA
ncbi:alpha/beta fold hydrolase [Methylobacterium organophilum]|uniref:Pyrethroid hydrolase n=1 Tax=Methylobacterium organophilum TaxID=410 RepID=A0ABQ4TH26_METOR|nr:alpha/beta fold hydrolase [Methylobacterium organophilum]GJE29455.1 Pyrethroid hydrolase [Methylobacterium organophilum]